MIKPIKAWVRVDHDGYVWGIQTYGRNQGTTSREAKERLQDIRNFFDGAFLARAEIVVKHQGETK